MRGQSYALYVLVAGLFFLPATATAQSSGAIAGVVKDTTGAVLPGVTVEAKSPALIEKVRTALTNDQGEYRIVDLRPGTYSVTFTLAGFGALTREGIKLTTGFTAPVSIEMVVGSLEESVTVTGASPVVDIQNTRTQNVLSQEFLAAIPVSKTGFGFATVTLGAVANGHDVGGSRGEQPNEVSLHGISGRDMKRLLDGMSIQSLQSYGGGQVENYRISDMAIQEVVVESGSNAEAETGGIQLNYVPKDGGNQFAFLGDLNYADSRFQAENLDDELRARGITTAPSIKEIYDYGLGLGGPVLHDKMWFYSANRWWGAEEYKPGAYYNATVGSMFYTPDLSRPATSGTPLKDYTVRLTWQVTKKQKVTISDGINKSCQCGQGVSGARAPEAARSSVAGWTHLLQGTWTYVVTNNLLVQAGSSNGYYPQTESWQAGATPQTIGIQELSTGLEYNSISASLTSSYGANNHSDPYSQRASLTYTTGSHSLKLGATSMFGRHNRTSSINESLTYQLRNRLPASLIQWVSPMYWKIRVRNYGVYAQDQWTMNRLTANLGVRFDQFGSYTLEDDLAATRFQPARHIPGLENTPLWRDVAPRLGVAYDLFGNAKTALKGTFGRYVATQGVGIAEAVHPALAVVSRVTRTWNDVNGDFLPGCDLTAVGANGECGALSNSAFGSPVVNTQYTDALREGWGVREHNWQTSVALQHELAPNVALNVNYFRTWLGGKTVTRNQAVTAENFTGYCITAPVDSRLPDGGGNRICGLYDVNPAQFGRVNNIIDRAAAYGEPTQVFNGVDVGINARFGRGGLLTGGVSTSRTVVDDCYGNGHPELAAQGVLASTPRTDDFCRTGAPWTAGTQLKFSGMYPLPRGFEVSATFQNLPGAEITSELLATNAMVAPELGRNLSAGANATTLIGLIPKGTMFEERLTQIDLRLTKALQLGDVRVRGRVDLYNVFNANNVLTVNTRYGSAWLAPTSIVGGRLLKVGASIDF